jgi:hypothetical protein
MPAEPDVDEEAAAAVEIHNGLMQLRDGLAPVFDAADGMRADLRARGWSEENAQVLALTWTQRIVANFTPLVGGPQ